MPASPVITVLLTMCCLSALFNTVAIVVLYFQLHGASAPVVNGRLARIELEVQGMRQQVANQERASLQAIQSNIESNESVMTHLNMLRARFTVLEREVFPGSPSVEGHDVGDDGVDSDV